MTSIGTIPRAAACEPSASPAAAAVAATTASRGRDPARATAMPVPSIITTAAWPAPLSRTTRNEPAVAACRATSTAPPVTAPIAATRSTRGNGVAPSERSTSDPVSSASSASPAQRIADSSARGCGSADACGGGGAVAAPVPNTTSPPTT